MSKRRPPAQAVHELLQRGYQLHQQGQWEPAATLYKDALQLQPRNFDALHLLGMLSLQTQNAPAAVEWMSKAVAVNPRDPVARSMLGVALQANHRPEEALASFEHAIRIQPDFAEAHYNRGKILRELHRPEDALASYEAAIKLRPNYLEALNNRSELLLSLHRPSEALACADQALQINPEYPEALGNRGSALLALRQPKAALESLDRALHLNPRMPKTLYNRGNVLAELGHNDDALDNYERAISLHVDVAEQALLRASALRNLQRHQEALACAEQALIKRPNYPDALIEQGLILDELRKPLDALICYERALSLRPNYTEALCRRGNVFMRMNRFPEALADYKMAATISPQNPSAHWNLCLCLLLTGNFEAGWKEYESRWSSVGIGAKPVIEKPLWDGNRIENTLMVWGEQGLGDQIIYASMLNEVASYTKRLVVAVDKRLHALFGRSFPDFALTTLENIAVANAFDVQVPMGNLSRHLRHNEADFLRNRSAYLKADGLRATMLRRAFSTPGTQVCGLSWKSSNHTVGREKSMSLLDMQPLLSAPGCRFVDLQYGDTTDERDVLRRNTGIEVLREPSVDTWNDIDGLAALVEACDIIITISNTTAHIAGALGKDVYLMLPYSQGRFWYWQTDRNDTLWYPNVRVFRQPAEDDWTSVIAQVRDALAARAAIPA